MSGDVSSRKRQGLDNLPKYQQAGVVKSGAATGALDDELDVPDEEAAAKRLDQLLVDVADAVGRDELTEAQRRRLQQAGDTRGYTVPPFKKVPAPPVYVATTPRPEGDDHDPDVLAWRVELLRNPQHGTALAPQVNDVPTYRTCHVATRVRARQLHALLKLDPRTDEVPELAALDLDSVLAWMFGADGIELYGLRARQAQAVGQGVTEQTVREEATRILMRALDGAVRATVRRLTVELAGKPYSQLDDFETQQAREQDADERYVKETARRFLRTGTLAASPKDAHEVAAKLARAKFSFIEEVERQKHAADASDRFLQRRAAPVEMPKAKASAAELVAFQESRLGAGGWNPVDLIRGAHR